jgi:hypothetical protein
MPRKPRLDIPGLLHHVIVGGIERRTIFRDDGDRWNFIDRYGRLLLETGPSRYAEELNACYSDSTPGVGN